MLMVAIVLLVSPVTLLAQHGGGGGGRGVGGGTGGGAGRPGGVSEKDDLKDFHRAMAVQATDEQRAAFAKVAQFAQAASDHLQAFRESLQKGPASSSSLADRATAVDQAIEQARAGNQNFLTSFSSAQKSGLKDLTGKLSKADFNLGKQLKALDEIVQTPKSDGGQIANSAAALDKELASFQDQQLALGREMGILLSAAGQDLAFNLPKVTNSINVASQPVSISASGVVSRTSGENGQNLFSLKLVADLSDLQQNITGILRSQVNRSPRCGERIEIQQATLTPLPPASLVAARLRFERWACPLDSGTENPMEVAAGDATIVVKLTPSVEANAGLRLASEITRVEADGFLRNLLRSGHLGETLRDQIAASLLSALQKGADLKATLPPAALGSATFQRVQFLDAGAGQLNFVLDGQLQFSAEQTQQFGAQLKQRLSAKGAPTP
jgi:hypothetical protein